MGKEWDRNLLHEKWLIEALRVLKPGASMLVMGGTRTFHRLACAMEDTGFIIKDCLMWIYGSGFPKAQELSKLVDAKMLGISIKEVGERREKIADNPNARKTHGLNPIPMQASPNSESSGITLPLTLEGEYWDGWKVGGIKPAYEPILWAVKPPEGSYVDNVLKWGVGAVNVDECRIGLPVPPTGSGASHIYGWKDCEKEAIWAGSKGRFPANLILDEEAGSLLGEPSRFFYCAKASKNERGKDNNHPTVKPIKLFEWLIKLVTREGQIVLDPFFGSGTTGLACQNVGRKFISIEKDSDYCKIAEERLAQGVL